jgi:hypothetical protein
MSQHDLNIANQGFPAFRADLNDALVALGSTNSGATAPATPYANQLWYDTANNILKIRNEDNDAWISIVTLDQSGDLVSAITASTVNAGALNATGVTTVQAGTAAAPAITTTGDTNTGIFFPTADTIAFSEGGVEVLRINSSSNVGIGTTNPLAKLTVSNGGAEGLEISPSGGAVSLTGYNRSGGAYSQVNITGSGGITLSIGTSNINTNASMSVSNVVGVGGATPSASGAGITFPATQSASSDVNTLDDYEEGTWTPTLVSTGGGAPAYTTQVGKYCKIGKMVYLLGSVQINGTLPAGNYTRIQGIPFTQSSLESAAAIKYRAATGMASGEFISAVLGALELSFFRNNGNGEIGGVGLNASYISTTFSVIFSTMYEIS